MRVARLALCWIVAAVVAAGLVPPADAAPLTCGSVVRKSKTLTSDLNCTEDGLIIGANGITLNLGGHTITGDGDVGDFGVDNTRGKDNVVIKNGTVQNFDDGVRIGSDTISGAPVENVIKDITAINNTADGIDLDEGRGHRVIRVIASNNLDQGMDIDANRNLVRNSTANDNADTGVDVEGRRNVVANTTTSGNGDEGTEISGNRNTVSGGSQSDNDSDGVDVEGNSNLVKGVNATLNAQDGVEITGNNNRVKGSTASTNDENGIKVESGDGTKINDNIAHGNGLPLEGGTGNDLGLGVDAQADPNVQGTGTEAEDNDDPAQCRPDDLDPPLCILLP